MAGSGSPSPLGADGNTTSTIDAGTLALTATPPPGAIGTTPAPPVPVAASADKKFSIEDAVRHLDKSAHAKSQGKCARYVREAIEAGGVTIPPPRPLYAKDYGPKLVELGFSKLDPKDYAEQKGDVVVFEPPSGEIAGHIQMHNGKTWVSDFVQGEGIYPGPAYRKQEVAHEIFRP